MNTQKAEVIGVSTFAQRFEYARDRQRALGTWQEDEKLAKGVGVKPSGITAYKARHLAPPANRTLRLAKLCGVDPGWLAFGEDSAAPAPEGFDDWMDRKNYRRLKASAFKPVKQRGG